MLYNRKILQGIKFGCLAVRAKSAKLKFANIILHETRNDLVALLAPSSAPLHELCT